MKHSSFLVKVSTAVCVLSSGVFLSQSAQAQTNYYFDPGFTAAGNGSGGTGVWDTDGGSNPSAADADWYLPGTGDTFFPDTSIATANADFDGVGGTVTVAGSVTPFAVNFDGSSPYTVSGSGSIDYQVNNGDTFISNSGANVDLEANSTVNETTTGINQVEITNSGSGNLTIGGTMAFSGSDQTANDTDNNPGDVTYGYPTNEPTFAVNISNTGGGTLNFNSTVTNQNLGNTTAYYNNNGTLASQSVGELFSLTFTAGTNEFNGNILGSNTGYDADSGAPTTDNLTTQNVGTTLLVDNANFDRFQVEGGSTFLFNAAGTYNANNNFTSQSSTVGSDVAGDATLTGSIANFGGTQTLEATNAAGRFVMAGDSVYGGVNGSREIISGSGIVEFSNTGGNDYATRYNTNSGSESDVGTEINPNSTLVVSNTSGSATGGGYNQNSQPGGSATGLNNVVQVDPTATLAGTGYLLQEVVTSHTMNSADYTTQTAVSGTGILNPGALSDNRVSSIGTLHLDNGLDATNGLTVKFDLAGTTSDQIEVGRYAAQSYNSSVPINGAPAFALTLNGAVTTFAFNAMTAITNGQTDTLFYSGTDGTGWDITNLNSITSTGIDGYTATYSVVTNDGVEDLDVTFSAAAVPEPTTWALIGLGGLILIGAGKHRRLTA